MLSIDFIEKSAGVGFSKLIPTTVNIIPAKKEGSALNVETDISFDIFLHFTYIMECIITAKTSEQTAQPAVLCSYT